MIDAGFDVPNFETNILGGGSSTCVDKLIGSMIVYKWLTKSVRSILRASPKVRHSEVAGQLCGEITNLVLKGAQMRLRYTASGIEYQSWRQLGSALGHQRYLALALRGE